MGSKPPDPERADAPAGAGPDRSGKTLIRRIQKRAWTELEATVAALEAAPADVELALKAARLWAELGMFPRAVQAVNDCFEAAGPGALLYREGGLLFLDAGLCQEAVKWLTLAISLAEPIDRKAMAGLNQAIACLVRDASGRITPGDRRGYMHAMERLARGQPRLAEPLFAKLAHECGGLAPAWLGWRGALEAQGRAEAAAALEGPWRQAAPGLARGIRAAMGRRLSPRGMAFDPREPMPIRAPGESLVEVKDAASLHEGGDRLLMLERGGQEVVLEPVIPLAALGERKTRFTYQRGDKFAAALEGGALVGAGMVLNRQGELPAEALPPCGPEKALFHAAEDGLIADPGAFRDGVCPIQVWDEPALLMACPVDSGFGDWMLNVPDRLALAEAAGLDLPLVLREGTSPRFVEILASLGWDPGRVIIHDPRGISIFPRLYTTSWPLFRWHRPMDGHLGIYRRAPGRRTAPPGRGERLYISREAVGKRPMTNEPEIRAIFERRGFRAVRPEKLRLGEVKDLFANADVIGGPYGSAFLNVVHAPTPPVAMVIMPPDAHRFLNEIALWLGSSGVRFCYVFGDAAPGRGRRDPWSAPAAEVEAALDELLAVAAGA